MDNDAYGGSGDLAGSLGGGNYSDAGGSGVSSVDAGYFSPGGEDFAASLGLDIGTRGTSTAPDSINVEQGQTLQGALAQALFDRLSQIDYTTPEGMAQGRFGLDSMSNLGLGRTEGLNPNNPTQSVDEMRNAQMVQDILGYVAPAIASLVPGYGTISTIGRVGAGLMSGTMTPGQAFSLGLSGLLGAKTGVPSGIFEGIFEGNLGKAAGSGAQAGLTSLANSMGPLGGLAVNLSGIGPSFNKAVSDAVSGATGGRSGGISSLPGAGPAPSTSTAPTGGAYGDAGITQEISPTKAAIEQAARETMTPAWDRQVVAGRYGPTVQYEYGA